MTYLYDDDWQQRECDKPRRHEDNAEFNGESDSDHSSIKDCPPEEESEEAVSAGAKNKDQETYPPA
jgi:hypothetical protein